MKQFLYISLLALVPIATHGQLKGNKTDSLPFNIDDHEVVITAFVDSKVLAQECRKALVDSLNNYSGGPLPYFLSDLCIEHRGKYFEGLHTTECLRCVVLDSVKNKNALQLILRSKSSYLDKICTEKGYLPTPHGNESMRQLIKKRLEEME